MGRPRVGTAPAQANHAPAAGSQRLKAVRHERFSLELLVDDNQTQAAIRAGYSPRGAHVTACRLLRNAKVADRIAYLRAARNQRVETKGDEILRAARASALLDLRKAAIWGDDGGFRLKPSNELDEDTATGIHGIEEQVTETIKPDGTRIIKRRTKITTDKTRNREIVLRAQGKLHQDQALGGSPGGIVVNVLIGPGVVPPAKQEGPRTVGGVMVLTKP